MDEKQLTEDAYFGQRKVKGIEPTSDSQIIVRYEDDGCELMHEDEWLKGRSAEPRSEDRGFAIERLSAAANDILKVLYDRNVRIEDLVEVLSIVRDTIQLRVNKAKEVAFNAPAWTVRLGDVQRLLDGSEGKFETPDVVRMVGGGFVQY